MSEDERSDKEGDIFDNISDNDSNLDDQREGIQMISSDREEQQKTINNQTTLKSLQEKAKQVATQNSELKFEGAPLPMLQGTHSLGPDMKFGWKPEVEFSSAPIPLYFNFVEVPLQSYYEDRAYQSNSMGNQNPFKIIYYGMKPKDSFDMHKNFVKPGENTYEFNFPKFYGLATAKAFYDSMFEDFLEGEAPRRDEMREFTGMSPDIDWNEIHFNSNFESGNLDMVVKIGDNEYDLFLRVDTNTKGYFNWFHFEVSKTQKGRTVRFNIVNMSKRDSCYSIGQQINYWSQKKNQPQFQGWQRGGSNIQYGRSKQNKEGGQQRQKNYYMLSFDYTFEYEDDHVWFAYTIPYSYSMLTQYIKSIMAEQKKSLNQELLINTGNKRKKGKYIQEQVLCKSHGGVDVPILTITNFKDTDIKTKKIVFIQARIHPCETSSSWIAHGIISFLISKSKVANELRKRLIFKIVPMLNPDGVIIGNTRATLLGRDMNRQYQPIEDEDPKLNPIPIAIREEIQKLIKDDKDKILAFWDLHQHSKKKAIFVLGPYFPLHTEKYLQIRIMPKLLSERSDMFRFWSSRFRFDKYKENCARITVGKMFNITNCFTLECSSYGYITKDRQTIQFKEIDLIEFGKSMCECLLEYVLIMEREIKLKEEIKIRMKERKKKKRPMIKDMIQPDSQVQPLERKQTKDKVESDGSDDESRDSESMEEEEQDGDEYGEENEGVARISHKYNTGNALKELEKDQDPSDDEEDRFYSDDEEEDGSASPVTRPNDLKGLLKHKQKKSLFDPKIYELIAQNPNNPSYAGMQNIRTLDEILNLIQNDDMIHEAEDEDDNSDYSQNGEERDSDSEGDGLESKDQQVLQERILHAIQVFSKWSPNPKKDILQQKRMKKLSIENRSIASSKKSNKSDTKSERTELKEDGTSKNINRKGSLKKKKQKVIDQFMKEFNLLQQQQNMQHAFHRSQTHVAEIDEEALTNLSQELLKQKKQTRKKKLQKAGQHTGDLLLVKSFGAQNSKQGKKSQQDQVQQIQQSQIQQQQSFLSDNQSQKQGSIVVGSARKIILQKYFQINGQVSQPPSPKEVSQPNEMKVNVSNSKQGQSNTIKSKVVTLGDNIPNVNSKSHFTRYQPSKMNIQQTGLLLGYDQQLVHLNEAILHKKKLATQTKPPSLNTSMKVLLNPTSEAKPVARTRPTTATHNQIWGSSSLNESLDKPIKIPRPSKQDQSPLTSNKINPQVNPFIRRTRRSYTRIAAQKVDVGTNMMMESFSQVYSRQKTGADESTKNQQKTGDYPNLSEQSLLQLSQHVYDNEKINGDLSPSVKSTKNKKLVSTLLSKKFHQKMYYKAEDLHKNLMEEPIQGQQVGLQQWMDLSSKGIIQQPELFIKNSMTQGTTPTDTYAHNDYNQHMYQQFYQHPLNFDQVKKKLSKIVDKPLAQRTQELQSQQSHISRGQIYKGKTAHSVGAKNTDPTSLLIKNELRKPRQNYIKKQGQRPMEDIMRDMIANKSDIVRTMILGDRSIKMEQMINQLGMGARTRASDKSYSLNLKFNQQ